MANRGLLVCLEGIDNSGKTAVARRVVAQLRSAGRPALISKEFSTVVGKALKASYLSASAELKTLLFAADRIERQQRLIEPALRSGSIVVADRWTFSAFAYRLAEASQADRKRVRSYVGAVNSACRVPDLVFYLDIPVPLAIARRKASDLMPSKIVLKKARIEYLEMCRRFSFIRVDATQPAGIVAQVVFDRVVRACDLR
jgi:dTMP kinase